MVYLTFDIIIDILQKLPIKSLLRFKGVCKSWQHTIESPQFVKMHLDYYSQRRLNNEKIMVRTTLSDNSDHFWYIAEFLSIDKASLDVGMMIFTPLESPASQICYLDNLGECACDGMVLLNFYSELFLWNPSTRKFNRILTPATHWSGCNLTEVYGFGFDPTIDDYKLVGMAIYDCDVRVFTLKSNSWRIISNGLPEHYEVIKQNTVVYNGAVHFIAMKDKRYVISTDGSMNFIDTDNYSFDYVILAFDLATETIEEIQVPQETSLEALPVLIVFMERLCLQWHYPLDNFELWLMMDYGNSNSWSKIISIPYPNECRDLGIPWQPICEMQNGDILIGKGNMTKQICSSEFKNPKSGLWYWKAVTYVESLVCPN